MKHSLHGKLAASVLLKLSISGNDGCHTTDAPQCMSGTLFSNVNKHTLHDPWGPEKYDYTMMNPGRHFTAAIPVMFFYPLMEFYFKLFISACGDRRFKKDIDVLKRLIKDVYFSSLFRKKTIIISFLCQRQFCFP